MDPRSTAERTALFRPQPDDWESQRCRITQLYATQSLPQVMATMEQEHGFKATKKQFETRIERWGIGKKTTEGQKDWMIGKQKRRLEDGKDTNFVHHGRAVSQQLLNKHAVKRRREEKMGEFSFQHVASAPTPASIQYETPSARDNVLTPSDRPVVGPMPMIDAVLDQHPSQNFGEFSLFPHELDVLGTIHPEPADFASGEDCEMVDLVESVEPDQTLGTFLALPGSLEGESSQQHTKSNPAPDISMDLDDREMSPLSEHEEDFCHVQNSLEEKSCGSPKRPSPPPRDHMSENIVWLDDNHTPTTISPSERRFLIAAQRGHLSDLCESFRFFVFIDATCDQGATALHYAAYMGHDCVVQALLDRRANLGFPLGGTLRYKGKLVPNPTPLRLAAIRGKISVVRILLEASSTSRRERNGTSYLGISEPGISLAWALQFGQMEIACLLLGHGARLQITPHVGHLGPGNPESFLPVRLSQDSEQLQVGTEIGLRFVDRVLGPEFDEAGFGITRTGTRSLFSIQRAKQHTSDSGPSTTIDVDYSSYLCGVDLGLLNVVSQLAPFFERQRDVHNWTPLHHAVIVGNVAAVNAMLAWGFNFGGSWGSDPNVTTSIGFTPLHLAVGPAVPLTEQSEIIASLLNHGAAINQPAKRGRTPIHIASEHHNLQAMSQLLTRGFEDNRAEQANPNSAVFESSTPLDLALSGHASTFETAEAAADMLLLAGADVNGPGRDGRTALHHAARARNIPLVHLLLEFGGDPLSPDCGNPTRTPLHYAVGEALANDNKDTAMRLRSCPRFINASSGTELEVLSVLLASLDDGKRDSAIFDHGEDLLRLATERGSLPCVRLLLQRSAVTDREGLVNYTIIRLAASKANEEMVRMLLMESIQTDVPDRVGYDMFLRLFSAFLDSSDESALVRYECTRIITDGMLQEQLLQMAKERDFCQLVQYWEAQMGVGCCDPAAVFPIGGQMF
ncbi:ankyrin repeat-containing domain protein [Immersiella caudata]|uniref:Ankyrin repeat-containing domain protein n=1 Tax=Immersiella caudata TaxID=314043 RepID=A0AA40BUU2_9PEZI|nr:ankyrin repeat-containing domain protein [Immersiella caudata]